MCDKSDIEMDSKEKVKLKANIKPETIIEEEPLGKVSEDTRKLVEKLVYLQDKYEFADEKVIQSVNVSKQYCNFWFCKNIVFIDDFNFFHRLSTDTKENV